ncbi:MAG: hypothetical protein ABW194_01690 [Novosphingobium sp.]
MTAAVEPRVKAVFLFNHRFERNVPTLEALHKDRFSRRHYIMPFASEPAANVSRVYEQGRYFSGHLAQATPDFVEPGITHYAIIPDDLLLNPSLDETNLIDRFGLAPGQAYIKNLAVADTLRDRWPWAVDARMAFRRAALAVDHRSVLPPATDARAKFEAMGLRFGGREGVSIARRVRNRRELFSKSRKAFLASLVVHDRVSDYPLLCGYSDFLIIPAEVIETFAMYCGMLAAMNVFAEVAVPTALALAATSVRTELRLNSHFMDQPPPRPGENERRGVEFWDVVSMQNAAPWLEDGSLDRILASFPPHWNYIHPVKLSRSL